MGQGALLTQTRMEKKEKVMAALALLLPRRKYLGGERCHWLARKQNPTAQTPAQMTGRLRERRGAVLGAEVSTVASPSQPSLKNYLEWAAISAVGVGSHCDFFHFNQLKFSVH